MEGFLILVLLGIVAGVVVLPLAALITARRAARETEALRNRVSELERELVHRSRPGTGEVSSTLTPQSTSESSAGSEEATRSKKWSQEPAFSSGPQSVENGSEGVAAPIVGDSVAKSTRPVAGSLSASDAAAEEQLPPPLPPEPAPPSAGILLAAMRGTLNWEQFMGAKLYAWIGGLALFLAVGYFVKYSFERGWIPPGLRVAMGFALGLGLVAGGVMIRRRQYTILSHTLCATGVLVLYGVTFACRAIYQFPMFGVGPAFGLMALITAAGFLLAVRMEARSVAVLGMLGGFLTPILLSTGQDAPVVLFSYIGLLDAGLLAVALSRRWFFLSPLAVFGTVLMQVGWTARFFSAGQYFEGSRILIPMAVLLGFNALWLGAMTLERRRGECDRQLGESAVALVVTAFCFACYFQTHAALALRPWLLFGFVFVLDGVILAISRLDRRLAAGFPLAGVAVFACLSFWMSRSLTNELMPAALTFTLVFALAHTLLPLWLRRRDGVSAAELRWTMFFPPLALLALLIPVFKLPEVSVLIWPVILLVDVLAVALAAVTLSVSVVVGILVLTLLAALGAFFKIPPQLDGLPTLLVVIGASAALFIAASAWLRGKVPTREGSEPGELEAMLSRQLPAFAVVLPFLLLVIMVGRLDLPDPSPVFGLAMLLVVLLLAATRMFRVPWLPLIGLACVVVLEQAWQSRLLRPESAPTALAWQLMYLAAFGAYPFALRGHFRDVSGPWVASALSLPAQFFCVHDLVRTVWPNEFMGLLAAAFALPALAGLAAVVKRTEPWAATRQTQIALYGGVALFFITLIAPLQFSRQWITMSWALEGAALCWLFHRVPHPGLRLTGVGLLVVCFVRLALNPAVFSYQPRAETPIFNWYLYTYGLAIAALFLTARLLAPARDWVAGFRAPPILVTLGTILAFLLMNIQIADFFTPPGEPRLTFRFSGHFARDMSYSVGWALFALGLLVAGLLKKLRAARYAALALLGVTMLKLFLHDLARLDALYRIGALAAVAVVALIASFLYQKFTAATPETEAASGSAKADP